MAVDTLADVEFGAEVTSPDSDTSLSNVRAFADAVGWQAARFQDHERARQEGLPGALVPGIMGVGFLASMIHEWAPSARIASIDTVFRAPMLADEPLLLVAVVTDVDEKRQQVELDLTAQNQRNETRLFGTAVVDFSSP